MCRHVYTYSLSVSGMNVLPPFIYLSIYPACSRRGVILLYTTSSIYLYTSSKSYEYRLLQLCRHSSHLVDIVELDHLLLLARLEGWLGGLSRI